MELLIELRMDDVIQKECEVWSAWGEFSKDERDEAFAGYLSIAVKGAEIGYEAALKSEAVMGLIRCLEVIEEQADMHDNPFASQLASEALANFRRDVEGL